jgi:hypothetical protein
MSSLRLPPPQTTLQLYRHLLREATYLPPVVKPFFVDRIRTRFQRHKTDPEPEYRLNKAHKDLRYLRAANGGDYARMRRVLMLGFGRIGRRRRELIDELIRRDKPTDTAELEKFIADTRDSALSHNDWLGKWNTVKILALTRSQSTVDLPETPLPTKGTRTSDPAKNVPTENVWGRPLSPKLARSKLRKEYKFVIRRLLPPVEEKEWELLKQLAAGQGGPEWDTPSRRRTVAKTTADEDAANDEWEWEDYILKPVRAVDAKRSRRMKALTGAVDETSPFPKTALGIHKFNKRVWQRLYTDIWRMTPKMEPKPQWAHKWEVQWGVNKLEVSKATADYAEFFEGTSNTPAPTKSKKSH